MMDRSDDATLRETSELPEAQRVQIQIVESAFNELAQAHRSAENHFHAGYRLMMLGDYHSAMRCFEDASFYAVTLARRYESLRASIRPIREYTVLAADAAGKKDTPS
jgi:phosphoheptose isomerase